jgi:fructoselysine-6-P-deglycase FrlB-like protein
VIHVVEEIQSQPAFWDAAAALASEHADVLPKSGDRVAFTGCGTSYYVGQSAAAAREAAGLGESDAFPASEMPSGRAYDLVVALSRSGTTTEVLDLVERLVATVPVLAITAVPASPIAGAATNTIALPFADERSVVQTRFATCVLALLRAHLGETLSSAISDAERALAEPLPIAGDGWSQIVFLGQSSSVGLAREAALKVREAAQAWSEAYPAMEYRHGPISVAGPDTVVWALTPLPNGLDDEILTTGARLVNPRGDPLAELVRIQRLAVARAESHGLDPDRPRNLTRSVVLNGDVG